MRFNVTEVRSIAEDAERFFIYIVKDIEPKTIWNDKWNQSMGRGIAVRLLN